MRFVFSFVFLYICTFYKQEMAKKKYRYNPQTLSYEQIEHTWRFKLKRLLMYLLASLFGGVAFFFLFISMFPSPREKQLIQERKQLMAQYSLLDKQVDQLQRVLVDLQQRDENLYRVVFQAEPIPSAIRQSGANRPTYYEELAKKTNEELAVGVTQKVDAMKKQLYVQSKSYDEIVKLANENEERLLCIPAIQPVLNKDLKRVASGYGWRIDPVYHTRRFHEGMDFTAPTGTDVYATGNATVSFAGWKPGYGNCIILNHGYGYESLYAHLHKIHVRRGQKVTRGYVIGLVGNTGKSTGPHLHYEVHLRGKSMNPQNYYFKDLSPEEYDQMVQLSNNAGQMFD